MKNYFLILISVFLLSCKKNQLGGSAEVKGIVKHHTKIIPFTKIYIKFNAKEFPGSDVSVYDEQITTDIDGNFKFNCYKGNYYIYGVGVDNAVIVNNGKVEGGVPINVRTDEKISITVPVTEGD